MKIEIVTTEQRLKEIVPLWNDIVDNSPLNYLPEWVISWWKINKEESKEIHMYLAWDESQLMAIMPTMIECKENDAKILTFMATDVSDRQGIITNVYSETAISAIVDCIDNDPSWTEIHLANILADDIVMSKLRYELIERGYVITESMQDKYSQLIVRDSWKEYLRKKKRNVRHAYRDSIVQIERFEFRVNDICSNEDINKVIDIHKKRWDSVYQVSIYYDERRTNLIKQLRDAFCDEKKFIIFELTDKDVLVAYRMGVIYENIYYDWNTSYDPDYSDFSPGKVLIKYIYEYCLSNNIHIIDMMKGHERYKEELSNDISYVKEIWCNNRKLDFGKITPNQRIKQGLSEIKGIIIYHELDYEGLDKIEEDIIREGISVLLICKNDKSRVEENIESYIANQHVKLSEVLFVSDKLNEVSKVAQTLDIHTCLVSEGNSEKRDVAKIPKYRRPEFVIDSFSFLCKLIRKKM